MLLRRRRCQLRRCVFLHVCVSSQSHFPSCAAGYKPARRAVSPHTNTQASCKGKQGKRVPAVVCAPVLVCSASILRSLHSPLCGPVPSRGSSQSAGVSRARYKYSPLLTDSLSVSQSAAVLSAWTTASGLECSVQCNAVSVRTCRQCQCVG